MNRSSLRLAAPLLVATLVAACGQQPAPTAAAPDKAAAEAKAKADAAAAREKEGLEAGIEAVAYGFPLVIMDATRKKLTNVPQATEHAAPANQFAHMTKFPDAAFKDVVRANVDTLYSTAWLDLAKEPVVLSVPDTKDRFYLMPMVDAWTNIFASPGKRTTGTKAGNYAITGPGWTGKLPAGVKELKATTNMVWIIGRTQTNGPKDYAAVQAIQKQYKLTPLSAWGKPFKPEPGTVDPAIDMKLAPIDAVAKMGTAAYFDAMAALMKLNPPPAEDAPVVDKLAKIGIVAGQKFDASKLDPDFAKGLAKALPAALEKLTAAAKSSGAPVEGWRIPSMKLAAFGTDYGTRAVIALVGLGANLAADAVYPSAYTDAEGKPLNGADKYVLHFPKGQEPPVNAFWSVTMYDPNSFFVDNPMNRYAVSSWMPFKREADGSLKLHIQKDSPGKDKESNWLPAPAGEFNVTLRMYWPKDKAPSIIDGTWKPPGIKKAP